MVSESKDHCTDGTDEFPPSFVVAIGGSAGSFKEIVKIVASISNTFEGCVLIATHRTPDQRNTLAEVLGHRARIDVLEPEDEDCLVCTKIYVGNSCDRVEVQGDEFEVDEDSSNLARIRRIDDLFISVAGSSGANAVGIILSGMLSDGVEGLQAIHDAGGVCLIQDPGQAEHDSMPVKALAKVPSARVGSTEEIMSWLMEIALDHRRA